MRQFNQLLTYSAKRSLNSCSELPFPRLATKSVEHGGFPRLAMWWRDVGDASAGMMGWCCGNAYKAEKEKVVQNIGSPAILSWLWNIQNELWHLVCLQFFISIICWRKFDKLDFFPLKLIHTDEIQGLPYTSRGLSLVFNHTGYCRIQT